MKRLITLCLCLLLLCGLWSAVSAAGIYAAPAQAANTQTIDDIKALIRDKQFTEDTKQLLTEKTDVSQWILVIHCPNVDPISYSLSPRELAHKQSRREYYLIEPSTEHVYMATITPNHKISLSKFYDLTGPAFPSYPISALADWESPIPWISLCGGGRIITEIYSFSHSYVLTDSCVIPHPTVFGYGIAYIETKDGTFVRLSMEENSARKVDMTWAEYQQWLAAYEDYQQFFSAPEYYKYTNRQLDKFDELIGEYGTVDAYYQYVTPIREEQQEQNRATTLKMLPFIVGIPVAILLIIWRRISNRKKYKM